MGTLEIFGTRFNAGEGMNPPVPDNDNWLLMEEWRTPAEVMQLIGRWKDGMRKDLAADFTLRTSLQFRQDWDILIGMEKCTLWHYYGER